MQIVQQQLDAYNAKNIDALLATYAADAHQYRLHGELLAQGHAQMRARFLTRFAEPDLHARLLSRLVMGNIVTDLELVTRNFPEGLGTLEMLCIYELADGVIHTASFAISEKRLTTVGACATRRSLKLFGARWLPEPVQRRCAARAAHEFKVKKSHRPSRARCGGLQAL